MSVAELKTAIIAKVNLIEDEELLKAIGLSVGCITSDYDDLLSDLQKKLLETSLTQYENGEIISEEEADKQVEEWLKEK